MCSMVINTYSPIPRHERNNYSWILFGIRGRDGVVAHLQAPLLQFIPEHCDKGEKGDGSSEVPKRLPVYPIMITPPSFNIHQYTSFSKYFLKNNWMSFFKVIYLYSSRVTNLLFCF